MFNFRINRSVLKNGLVPVICLTSLFPEEYIEKTYTEELQWLEHLWNHENMFETGVVRVNEC